jgi:hypothetical protein
MDDVPGDLEDIVRHPRQTDGLVAKTYRRNFRDDRITNWTDG